MDENARRWREHIETWRRSGESIAAYCRREGLTTSGFGYWKRRLEQKAGQEPVEAKASGVRLARVKRQEERRREEQGREPPRGTTVGSLRLVVGRATVEVPPGFDAATLVQVLDVLETRGVR